MQTHFQVKHAPLGELRENQAPGLPCRDEHPTPAVGTRAPGQSARYSGSTPTFCRSRV